MSPRPPGTLSRPRARGRIRSGAVRVHTIRPVTSAPATPGAFLERWYIPFAPSRTVRHGGDMVSTGSCRFGWRAKVPGGLVKHLENVICQRAVCSCCLVSTTKQPGAGSSVRGSRTAGHLAGWSLRCASGRGDEIHRGWSRRIPPVGAEGTRPKHRATRVEAHSERLRDAGSIPAASIFEAS